MCGYVLACECMCICIVYMSASEQCCRLCNNSILFEVCNEKIIGIIYIYITVFDGICQYLEICTCQHCDIKAYIVQRPGSQSVTVVKVCCAV